MGSSIEEAMMKTFTIFMFLVLGVLVLIPGTFGQFGNYGSCRISICRTQLSRAEYCCSSGENRGCCSYTGGNGWNNGGNWGNGNYNNKPGQCPSYNGRKRRSPEQSPRRSGSSGRFFGNNGGWNHGWNNGGQGFNPGYNNGRCIRDSECPGSLKC